MLVLAETQRKKGRKKALAPNQKGRPRLYKKSFQEIKKKKKTRKFNFLL